MPATEPPGGSCHRLDLRRLELAYTNSFAAALSLRLDFSALLPSFDALIEVLGDPLDALSALVEHVSHMSIYVEFDPSYFARNMEALSALNLVLGVLKLLAVYGQKAFALYDAVKSALAGGGGGDDDDGTVQVRECVADSSQVRWRVQLMPILVKEKLDVIGFDGKKADDLREIARVLEEGFAPGELE